jgi:hypothetical protein
MARMRQYGHERGIFQGMKDVLGPSGLGSSQCYNKAGGLQVVLMTNVIQARGIDVNARKYLAVLLPHGSGAGRQGAEGDHQQSED